ncbi:MAG: hypothetical protein HUJ66_03955, partial [Oscillospiraceae bacterium]|nr:hypothetical protein [Oscillospiraceae bacterium]
MNRKAFIIAPGMSREQQTALCARMCEEMCGKRIAAGEVSIMPPCTPKAADTAAAEAANRRIVYLAAAGKNDRACFAYTEMSMVS